MEKVFWLMWLSDVAGSISAIGAVCAVAMGLSAVALVVFAGLDEALEVYPRTLKVVKWLCVPVLIATFVPNQKTIQVLAVASAADAAATTQIGAKSLEAMNAVLDRVIGEAKKK